MVTTPMTVLMRAVKRVSAGFLRNAPKPAADTIEEIIGYATQARKQGIVSLEQEAAPWRIRS